MKSRFRHAVISIVLAAVTAGLAPAPTNAQWTVFDPSQYFLQVDKKIEEATRWVQTVNHYVQMYEMAAQQYEKMVESVSNLRGILDKVDEQIMRHKQLITTYASLGRLIRDTFELKRRIENTITSQIQSVVNISRRLRNGIFDMEQNKRDLDDFFRHSIGRTADAELRNTERLAKLDAELERMLYDREMILLDLATLYSERNEVAERTREVSQLPPAERDGVESLVGQMLQINLRITQLEDSLRKLESKIQAKFVAYGLKTEQMTEFGRRIRETSEMMTGITTANRRFLDEIDRYGVGNGQ